MENKTNNQNQNLNKLLDQSLSKGQPQSKPVATNQGQTAIKAPMEIKSKSGLLVKILIALLFVLVIGLGVLGFLIYNNLLTADSSSREDIVSNKGFIDILQSKIDNIEVNLSDADTLDERITALQEKMDKYVTKDDLAPIEKFLQEQDSDNDGLSDYDEVILYGSNPHKKDTDGDGYDDKAEVDGGYNPAGPGKLGEVNLTEAEKEVIVGEWDGKVSSEVSVSQELSLNFDENGKITGSFELADNEDSKTIYNNTVTGTYTYDGENNKLNALLINTFGSTVEESGTTSKADEYRMSLLGTVSLENKTIIGTWRIDTDVPKNWPAGTSGNFQFARIVDGTSRKLDGDNDQDTTQIAKTISIRAFSYGYSPAEIELTQNERVIMQITSLDVDHTFTVDDLNIAVDVEGGQTVQFEYTPKTVGEFEYYSSNSGEKDAGMVGTLIVEEAKE